ncbi:hypothetical protein RP20_CCG004736 [Aedes albopictus]|nr:hypothetical protein RP20_CCG004736 [Aedes albopictus]
MLTNSSGTPTSDFDLLLQSSILDSVNKYVINKDFRITFSNLPTKPSLIVIYSEPLSSLSPSEQKLFRTNLHTLDTNSKVLVLVNTSDPYPMKIINELLTKWRFNYVVYLDVAEKLPKVIYVDTTGATAAVLNYFPHPGDLFRNAIRDMQGRPLIYAYCQVVRLQYRNWMTTTARYLNATALHIAGPCTDATAGLDCLMKLLKSDDMDISLDEFVFGQLIPEMYRMLFNILPDAEVILVPRGRNLNIVEMFIKPLRWETWSALVMILLGIEVLSWIFPLLFKNDPILLLVCGFERQNLHHASTRERLLFLPLVIFFFLMTNVYETKITSYMMHPPSIADIHSIQELIQSGIKIKVNMVNNRKIMKDELLGSILLNSSDSLLELDGIHAYIGDKSMAENVVRMLDNYDFELERPMYNILTERRKMSLYMFWIPFCTPLHETFYFTQKMMFEAGLWIRWIRQDWELRDAGIRRTATARNNQYLAFEDLVPAWIAISVGFTTSAVLFLLEFVFGHVCATRQIRRHELW